MTPRLCLLSSGGSLPGVAEVVADAVRAVGGQAHVVIGALPEPEPDTVYVVTTRDYLALAAALAPPPAALLRRTIGFCVDHPDSSPFASDVALFGSFAAAVAIDAEAAASLRAHGMPAEHFRLGHSPAWDAWGGDLDSVRDLDVTHIGPTQRRRSVLLGSYADDLDSLRTNLISTPDPSSEPLARSRFLLALGRPLDRVRALLAMCNGCVVVSEPSAGLGPLVPGEHLVVARPESLGAVVAALAADGRLERHVRATAYQYTRSLDLPGSARMLLDLAASVLRRSGRGRRASTPVPPPAPAPLVDLPSWDVRFAGTRSFPVDAAADAVPGAAGSVTVDAASAASAVDGSVSGDVAGLARVRHRAVAARRSAERRWVPARHERIRPDTPRADVDVLLVRRPGEPDPDGLVSDLLSGTVLPKAVLVGEDGVVPWSRPRPVELLVHEAPLGRGLTRNALLERSTAGRLLVLDGGMRASRHLLERLLAADAAEVVHCLVADPVDGLVGALPADGRLLRDLPYLGSGYLVRRSLVDELGGWTEDVLLEGMEDHVFWRRVAAGAHPTVLVPQILLRRARPEPEPRPVDLDARLVWSLVDAALTG